MNRLQVISSFLLILFHIIGALGTVIPNDFNELVLKLTPVNLLLSGFLLILTAEKRNYAIYFLLFSYFIGFAAEYIGVNTGLLFGDYRYGTVLGPTLEGVPLMIGVNWFILAYSIGTILNGFHVNYIIKIILGSTAMTLMDALIEPVAIELDYWSWEGGIIPFSNYAGWWLISAIIFGFFFRFNKNDGNKTSIYLISSQLVFFLTVLLF
jgi:putative membrane protein